MSCDWKAIGAQLKTLFPEQNLDPKVTFFMIIIILNYLFMFIFFLSKNIINISFFFL